MKFKLSIALLIAGVSVAGSVLPAAASAAEGIYKTMDATNEATEKEAHSRPHQWIQVMLSKYDGHCRPMGHYTARGFIDAVAPSQNEVHLISAEKVNGNDYVLTYKYGLALTDAVFVTSERLCEKVIKDHISQ